MSKWYYIVAKTASPQLHGSVGSIGSIVTEKSARDGDDILLCDGREVSRAEYPELFKVIGTLYGAGDGVTTFNLPDFRPYPACKEPAPTGNAEPAMIDWNTVIAVAGGGGKTSIYPWCKPPHKQGASSEIDVKRGKEPAPTGNASEVWPPTEGAAVAPPETSGMAMEMFLPNVSRSHKGEVRVVAYDLPALMPPVSGPEIDRFLADFEIVRRDGAILPKGEAADRLKWLIDRVFHATVSGDREAGPE